MGNPLIIAAVALDRHLHIPMYLFLMNLSMKDLGSISIIVPKSMANSLLNTRSISYSECVAQVFLFIFFMVVDFGFLTIMAYDRYVTICKPLHYESLRNKKACIEMAASAWISGIFCSALHTGNTFALIFFGGNMVDQFFCEIAQLLKLTCSDSYLNEVGVITFFACSTISCFVIIIVSYVQIFTKVLRILSERGRHKAVFTCLPHLIVVSLFDCTETFAYMKTPSIRLSGLDLVCSIPWCHQS
ncbi:olfactory receptor 14C36-like [Gopherus evgoodei]|uniref:olfactory receptor 14C36-like n=1 Tax=Gopherus evgoodei TaxID=1825980 RepID=UPI0011CF2512|nr:olfactory receptor 14C36-like [Gopherus evgoodei]